MRIANRVDDNQKAIVKVLRQLGCSVCHLHSVGKGCPDLAVALAGKTYLVEIKDGEKWKSQQKLTRFQILFHDTWEAKIPILTSVTDAVEFVNNVKSNLF